MVENNKCPKCGSFNVSGISDLSGDGLYRCQDCRTSFGVRNGHHPYADIFVGMEMELHSIRKESFEIKFVGERGNRQFHVSKGDQKDCFIGKMTEEEWRGFAERLFTEVYIDKWKANYFSTRISDGSTWTVNVSFEKKHALSCHGCNGYPAYWNSLISLVSPYLDQCGIEVPCNAD